MTGNIIIWDLNTDPKTCDIDEYQTEDNKC
jgi:hypothetical protein